MAEIQKEQAGSGLPFDTRILPTVQYTQLKTQAAENTEAFWAAEANKLDWDMHWRQTLDWQPPYARWFNGGKLNASVQCVDRHTNTWRKNKVAIYWEGENGEKRTLSYADLLREVNRCASALQKLGIKKGDKVALYLPLIPELPAFMLACARLGATHTVIFSGFSSKSICDRVNDTGAKLIITADGGYRRGKIIRLKELVDQAAPDCPTLQKTLVIKRTGTEIKWNDERDVWLDSLRDESETYIQPESVDSNHPLYILYTSGTTGKPKGIVHSTGGYMTYCRSAFEWAFGLNDEDIFWCTADIGWVTGHSAVVYGPLANGATIVLYEGAPDFPSIHRWWEIIDRYKITALYTSPTAIRMFMRQGAEILGKHSLNTLRILGSVGEPINPEAWQWYFKNVGKERCPIVDTWWQTETGSFMLSPTPGIEPMVLKPGSATHPMPGIAAAVVDSNGKEMPPGEKGFLVIRKPWPGMLMDVYNNPTRYKDAYWSQIQGVFNSGDFAVRDNDGYFWVLGRADEVLKVAGHRIGTAELEDAVVSHSSVAEAAVVSRPDEIKGDAIIIFATLKKEVQPSDSLKKEITGHLRSIIGSIATPDEIYFVDSMPKTRSGKIMRRILKAVASGQTIGDITTLEDETSVEEAKHAFENLKRTSEKQTK